MPCRDKNVVVGVIDVGSPKNIGWAVLCDGNQETGSDLNEFIECFSSHLKGRPAALGFEAPLFIPCRSELGRLTAQRTGENGRPWSAGAGATVTTIGLAIMVYTLQGLRDRLPNKDVTQDWLNWPRSNHMLLFEAFVSGENHAGPNEHWRDALCAANGFVEALPNLDKHNAVTTDNALSLVGACLLRTGWVEPNKNILSETCLVIRPPAI